MLGAGCVCVSGGVPLEIPVLQMARELGIALTNDAQLFLERCPAPVIGITGSAGKTTTTSLVAAIVERAGYKVWLGGNIGNPLIEDLPKIRANDIVVMELSSFQLELMTASPPVAAVLNLTPNHLDRHGSFEAYALAKANILRYQRGTDVAVLGWDDEGSRALERIVEGELLAFSRYEMVPDGAFILGERLLVAGSASYDASPHVVCQREEIPLRGDHNAQNVLAACAISGAMGLAIDRPGVMPADMREAIRAFKPIAHRLETVRALNGVTWVNDSIATAPERTLAALASYEEPIVLLIAAADKDLPWEAALQVALRKAAYYRLRRRGRETGGDKSDEAVIQDARWRSPSNAVADAVGRRSARRGIGGSGRRRAAIARRDQLRCLCRLCRARGALSPIGISTIMDFITRSVVAAGEAIHCIRDI